MPTVGGMDNQQRNGTQLTTERKAMRDGIWYGTVWYDPRNLLHDSKKKTYNVEKKTAYKNML
jgi:hypothetical protein